MRGKTYSLCPGDRKLRSWGWLDRWGNLHHGWGQLLSTAIRMPGSHLNIVKKEEKKKQIHSCELTCSRLLLMTKETSQIFTQFTWSSKLKEKKMNAKENCHKVNQCRKMPIVGETTPTIASQLFSNHKVVHGRLKCGVLFSKVIFSHQKKISLFRIRQK